MPDPQPSPIWKAAASVALAAAIASVFFIPTLITSTLAALGIVLGVAARRRAWRRVATAAVVIASITLFLAVGIQAVAFVFGGFLPSFSR